MKYTLIILVCLINVNSLPKDHRNFSSIFNFNFFKINSCGLHILIGLFYISCVQLGNGTHEVCRGIRNEESQALKKDSLQLLTVLIKSQLSSGCRTTIQNYYIQS